MDVSTIRTDHPEVAAALIAEGAAAERERIRAIEEQAAGLTGHDTLLAALKADGSISAADAAVQLLAAEKAKRGARLADLRADAAAALVPDAVAPPPGKDKGDADPDDEEEDDSPAAVAQRATQYQAEQRALGRRVSAAEAVAAVTRASKGGRHG